MKEQAKPCPFCGKLPTVTKLLTGERHYVVCENDDCNVCETGSHPTPEAAIGEWNTRAGESALLAACKEFVRKVDCGEARSTRSYAEMKAAIAKAEGYDIE